MSKKDQSEISEQPPFKSGFVAILGKPNAGKSTLMNALVGLKVSIVSAKPQTTRDRVSGILSTDTYQIVFVDMPGVIVPDDKLNETLIARVEESLEAVDILYHLVDATDKHPTNPKMEELLRRTKAGKKFLVVNKIDLNRDAWAHGNVPVGYDELIRVSALRGTGLDQLLNKTVEHLLPGPIFYDPDQLTDRDERFIAGEVVREKVFENLSDELPYAVHTETETFEERPGKDFIRVVIYVERESQKGIVIGHKGEMLKKIGADARKEIEEVTDRPCFLELWVKVRPNWRKSEFDLQNFGYRKNTKKKKKK